jgi:hypothetical protein
MVGILLRDHRIIQRDHPEFLNKYTIVKLNPLRSQVTFIYSPDFDTASEPLVGDAYLVKSDDSVRFIPQAKDPWVYHGKHLMVGPDYSGFNAGTEAEWHDYWNKEVKLPHTRIGRKSVWEKVRPERKPERKFGGSGKIESQLGGI